MLRVFLQIVGSVVSSRDKIQMLGAAHRENENVIFLWEVQGLVKFLGAWDVTSLGKHSTLALSELSLLPAMHAGFFPELRLHIPAPTPQRLMMNLIY